MQRWARGTIRSPLIRTEGLGRTATRAPVFRRGPDIARGSVTLLYKTRVVTIGPRVG